MLENKKLMNYNVLQYNLGLQLSKSAQNAECDESWDLSDVGNEIGYAIGKMIENMNDEQVKSFVFGIQHGISLTNGTH